MTAYKALVVDDESDIRELLAITLGRMGVDADTAETLSEARDRLAAHAYDLCLTDMRLPDGDGLTLVAYIQQQHPDLPVAMITAYGSVDLAVQALKAGAFDFISKPVDLQVLRNLVKAALRLATTKTFPERERRTRDELIGGSSAMQTIRSTIEKLARSQAPVYIGGESGTGKELVARLIHERGPRSDQGFIPVNCGAIPAELMESEFFGHKKGSFTGAVADKNGLFQAAEGGTLFLDEVAELPMHMQVKLLRAIQEKAIRPVGAQREIPVDVRILSATHKDLSRLVQDSDFRQDLYYRLNVIELRVPPLRERPSDIPLLAGHLLQRLSSEHGAKIELGEDAIQALLHYPFPGNVRELENILERAMTMCEGVVVHAGDLHLPDHGDKEISLDKPAVPDPGSIPLETYLDEVERDVITKTLERTRHNKTKAAELLGITFRALRYRLKKLGMD
jgi:two-component system response regulator PilR (NtrC family)